MLSRLRKKTKNQSIPDPLVPPSPPAPPTRPDSHLAGVHSSEQEAAAEHPGGELALRHLVAHRVVDDLHRGLLQHLRLLTCASATKKKVRGGKWGGGSESRRHVTPAPVARHQKVLMGWISVS